MILTFRRPGPPDTHALTMVNNVIAVVNYVIAAHPSLLNFMIADSGTLCDFIEAPGRLLQKSAVGPTDRPASGTRQPADFCAPWRTRSCARC
jgi:hypothetical protein